MRIQPYLYFNGHTENALDFYKRALGAKVTMMMRFKESPETPPPDTVPKGWGEKIMHSNFSIGDTHVMASDGCSDGQSKFEGFSLSLAVANETEADRCFNALAEGGNVQMPLAKTFWSPRFGMVTDRFGVSWMIGVFDGQTKTT
ncbi:MAG TPA: VOC family protein [Nitrospira sp.]|nr:VOC family protein [Nitrospira sp.]